MTSRSKDDRTCMKPIGFACDLRFGLIVVLAVSISKLLRTLKDAFRGRIHRESCVPHGDEIYAIVSEY